VIPAEARKLLNLNPGDQLVVIGNSEANVVSFLRADTIGEFFTKIMDHVTGTGLEEDVKKKFDKVFEMLNKE
jgi:bifunctional DNA-binding transcriptional regulator/antitoxin component of YhaV-PrlF toxin-antitoxin module